MKSSYLLLAVLWFALVNPSFAQGVPVAQGEAFVVLASTARQLDPDLARLASGALIVVYQEGKHVRGRFLNPDGVPGAPSFQISDNISSTQVLPAVAPSPEGGFIVVWDTFVPEGAGRDIRARRYDASGMPLHSTQTVADDIPQDYSFKYFGPAVATDDAGRALMVFEKEGDLYARFMDATGGFEGEAFLVNSVAAELQVEPTVASDGSDFIVAWHSGSSTGSDDSHTSIQAQRIDGAGMPQAADVQVNVHVAGIQKAAAIANVPGGFFVAWQSREPEGVDPRLGSSGVYARFLDPSGLPIGAEIELYSESEDDTAVHAPVDIAVLSEGTLWSGWIQRRTDDPPSSTFTIAGRGLGPDGVPYGGVFLDLQELKHVDKNATTIALASGNRFLVVWPDSSLERRLLGRVFRWIQAPSLAFFEDAFESGDLSGWP